MISQSIKNSKNLKNIFLVLFVVSTVVALFLLWLGPVIGNVFSTINSSLPGDPINPAPPSRPNNMENIALISSVAASITSLIGFFTTTLITWRKEKREANMATVEQKRLETELEKSKFELDRLKKSSLKKKNK